MTKEEAIKILKEIEYPVNGDNKEERDIAFDIAIKALEQEPCEDCISRKAVEEIINDIRDCISVEGYWAIMERMKKISPVNPQCNYTDAEIAKSFIEDVETVKDLLTQSLEDAIDCS